MKIALLGYGKMGRIVETVAARHGIEIVMHFTRVRPCRADEETRVALAETTLVDFSAPDAVLDNIRVAAALSLDLVVGTTGWHHQLEEVRNIVASSNIGLVYGSNFSIGVNLFYQIVEQASQLISAFKGYDPFIQELHHQFKKDAPSGTALVLQELVSDKYQQRQIPVTSVRAGHIPGTHAVSFDSTADTIRLEHVARNREGFAEGALLAAEWIAGRQGVYEFREVVGQRAGGPGAEGGGQRA